MNLAQWLREQPHDRFVVLRCMDVGTDNALPHHSAQPVIDIMARTKVGGRLANVMIRASDEVFGEPDYLQRMLASEIDTSAERLRGEA